MLTSNMFGNIGINHEFVVKISQTSTIRLQFTVIMRPS